MKIDITEQIIQVAEVPDSLRKYERMMQNREKEVHKRKNKNKRRSGENGNK